jgi:predicted Zn-ribbon and HTH transcriptional regulator
MKFALDRIEHENTFLAFMGTATAEIHAGISTTGARFMDSALQTMKAALEAIRDTATSALARIEQSHQDHSMRWKCKQCRYVKHFTKPVSLEAAGRCPRCKSTEFKPIL